jgi:hypothetical protein
MHSSVDPRGCRCGGGGARFNGCFQGAGAGVAHKCLVGDSLVAKAQVEVGVPVGAIGRARHDLAGGNLHVVVSNLPLSQCHVVDWSGVHCGADGAAQLRQWLQLHGDGGGGDSCKCAVTAKAAAAMAAVMAATARLWWHLGLLLRSDGGCNGCDGCNCMAVVAAAAAALATMIAATARQWWWLRWLQLHGNGGGGGDCDGCGIGGGGGC